MAMWHIMFGMGLAVFISVGVSLMSMMSTQHHGRKKVAFCAPAGTMCPICLENMANEEMRYLVCGHAVHEDCYKRLRRHGDNKCPTCREKI